MPLGAARITLLAFQSVTVEAEAEVIRKKVGVIANDGAAISTTQSKFGGASAYFDGVNDYLDANMLPPSDTFTIEYWIYHNNLSAIRGHFGWSDTGSEFVTMRTDGSIRVSITDGTYTLLQTSSAGVLSATTWQHVAVVKDGTSWEIFVDGTSVISTTSSVTVPTAGTLNIGTQQTTSAEHLGYIDEFRVSNTVRYTGSFTPDTTPFTNDDNTLLLLHMNGTNGSTFFEDDNGSYSSSSTRTAETVTVYGDAQIDTDQSKFGSSSLMTDTGGDYLTTPALLPATGDFTVEYWWRVKQSSNNRSQFGQGQGTTGNDLSVWSLANRTGIVARLGAYGSPAMEINASYSFTADTWYHIALTRSGSTFTVWINGVSQGTDTSSNSINQDVFEFAANSTTGDNGWGWWDELRVSDTCRYTASFTPSTTTFQNDSNTLLLLHMEGSDTSTTFTDDTITYTGRSQVGVSALGNAQVDTAQYKFGGASCLMDGTGDYLYIDDITLGSDWTIEGWFRFDSTGQQHTLFDFRESGNAPGVYYVRSSDNKLVIYDGGTTASTNTFSANTWYHIAFVSDSTSGTVKGYVDGVEWLSRTGANAINGEYCYLGMDEGVTAGAGVDGYIDEIRFSNTKRYTSSFTPSTTAFTNDANTVLLLHMDGTDASTDFRDDNGYHTSGRTGVHISAVGTAQVDTAQSKFGGASLLVDGNSDYLKLGSGIATGTGDFTYEGWVRFNSSGYRQHIIDTRDNSGADYSGVYITLEPTNVWSFSLSSSYTITSSGTASTGTWYHFAFVRSGSTCEAFVDGTSVGTVSVGSHDFTSDAGANIGANLSANTATMLNGWLDEFRVSDTARYTSGFTPSTTAFTDDANTLLLLHMDGADGSTQFTDDVGSRAAVGVSANGNAQVDTAQSKFGGASAYFDGTGDYLKGDLNYSFGTSQDLTWECWFRQDTNTNTYPLIFGNYTSYGVNDWGLFVDRNNDNTIRLFAKNLGDELLTSTTSIADDTWYHVAVTRSGSNWTLWVNGTSEDTATNSGSVDTDGRDLYVGADPNTSTTFFHGWIDELRWSDTARYTTSFTPETTPFQNDANTLILLHMDGTDGSTTFIDDNGMQ